MEQVIARPLPTTPEEFLAWQELQEERYEFDGRRPIPRNGGTLEHVTIELNITGELRTRLRGSSCQAAGGNMRVAIGPAFRYADASVYDTPVPRGSTFLKAPIVLFEVVSPSTRRTDHVGKLAEYRTLPSLRRYVLVEQHKVLLTLHVRDAHGWTKHTLDAGDMLRMPEIGVDVPVDEVYRDVFPAP